MAPETGKPRIEMIPRDHIAPDPDQPRTDADDELKGSIANEGMLEPIIVRPYPTGTAEQKKQAQKTPWMIVNGERRWRGSAGVLAELPCIVRRDERVLDAARRKLTQLAANEHKAMSPLDEGRAYQEIMLETGMSIEELADALGKPRSTVGDRVRLMELGPWLELIESGKVAWSRAVESLVPLRSCPREVHERAIERFLKDYRYQNDKATLSKDDFASVVDAAYQSEMYPLKKHGPHADRPTFDTSAHNAECECRGIKFDYDRRLHCGNPCWWRPLHRKALAEKKAKQPKSAQSGRARNEGPKVPKLPNGLTLTRTSHYHVHPNEFRKKDAPVVWAQTFHGPAWTLGERYYNGRKQVTDPVFDVETFCDLVDVETCTMYAGSYSGLALVTKDLDAFNAAVARWEQRRGDFYRGYALEFGTKVREGLDGEQFTIAGPGVTILLARLGVLPVPENDAAHRFDRDEDDAARHLSRAEQLLDIARALQLVSGRAADINAETPEDWCDFDNALEAGLALSGLAVALDRGLTFPTSALEAWEREEIARMKKTPIASVGQRATDPALTKDGNKWERRKKRGSAKHARPAEVEAPVRVDADGIQEIRTAAEAEEFNEELEEVTADA